MKNCRQVRAPGGTTGALGAVEMRAGNLAEARDWLEEARRRNLELGNRPRATDNAMVLSSVYRQLGDLSTARARLIEAAREAREMGDVARFPIVLEMGSAIALRGGRPLDALLLASAAAGRRAAMGGGVPNFVLDVAAVVAEARDAVRGRDGPDEADEAWAEGEHLDESALLEIPAQDPERSSRAGRS